MENQKVSVNDLPGILECDPNFVNNIYEFKNGLETPPGFWKPLYDNYRGSIITFTELLAELLIEWCGRMGEKATIKELYGVLNQMRCRNLAEQLKSMGLETQITYISKEKLPPPNEPTSSIHISRYNVGPALPRFVGRAKALQQLKQYYTNRSKLYAWKTVAVLGLGGIGKTQLVKTFLHDPIVSDANITWFSGESPDTLRKSIVTFAETINLENAAVQEPLELIRQCGSRLAHYRTWLVVIDNADENYDLIRELGIQLHSITNVFIIVTSRLRRTFSQFAYQIDVKQLDAQDSATLVRISVGENLEFADEDVQALSQTLQHFPLAIAQATAFIRETRVCENARFGIKEYIQEFETRSNELLSFQVDIDPYKKPTLIIWDMTINAIRKHANKGLSAMALRVLNILAFLHPDDIEISILDRIYSTLVPHFFPKFTDRSVNLLWQYSLIEFNSDRVQVHRLVQEATKIKLENPYRSNADLNFGQLQFNEYDKIINAALNCFVKECNKSEVFHLKHVWANALKSKTTRVSLGLHFLIPQSIFVTLKRLQLYRETYEFAQVVLAKIGGLGCKRIQLAFKIHLCHGLEGLGKQDEASSVMKEVFQEAEQCFGETDSFTLTAVISFINLLRKREEFSEAERLIEETILRCGQKFGRDHNYTKLFQWFKVASVSLTSEEGMMALHKEIVEWGLRTVPKDLQRAESEIELFKVPHWIFVYAREQLEKEYLNVMNNEYIERMNLRD